MGPNFNKGHAPYLEPRYYDQAFDLVACTTAHTQGAPEAHQVEGSPKRFTAKMA